VATAAEDRLIDAMARVRGAIRADAPRYRVKDDKRKVVPPAVAPLSGQTGHAGVAGMT